MFNPVPNGSIIQVPDNAFGFVFNCQLPPVGYGINVANGQLIKTDILERKDDEIEQYWERPRLPFDFLEKRKAEKIIQRIDRFHVDPYLEEIRKREWRRRLAGVWFYNWNPITDELDTIYLVGVHYLYLTHWKFQGRYNDFRIPDRNVWYARAYCDEDPKSLGLNELTKRKNGKTARSGCWLYERTSRLADHHGGIQSKTDDDSWGVFKKAIVHPWKTLPDFFRPRYDLMKGDDPNDELRLFAQSKRGAKAEEEDDVNEEPLNSWIDFRPALESGYDGDELHSYVSDETGKTSKNVSVVERQNVVRFASEIEGEFRGKHWSTTTVEPEKNEPENYEFQDLTAQSNPLDRNENGVTGSGYYTIFTPAQDGFYTFNEKYKKYGYPDQEKAKKYLNNTIDKYISEGNTRKASSFRRKNPQTFKEAFSADGENSLYNPELLNNRLDEISWTNEFTEFGDLEWEDGYVVKKPVKLPNGETEFVPSKVYWIPNPNGKFEKVKGWEPRDANNVYREYQSFMPNNNWAIRIGCDPFKYDKTKDKRRSNCAAFAYQIADPTLPTIYDDTFVLRYADRPESTRLANAEVLKMAWWCGCEVLFENNVNHWKNDFIDWECAGFLMWLPEEVEPGVNTNNNSLQTICNYTEAYINKFIKNVYFKTLIRKDAGWLGFKVEDHTKFDEPMGAGVTLIAVKGKNYKKPTGKVTEITEYFRMHRVG